MEKKQVLKKTAKIAGNVLLYVFIAVCIFGVILTVVSKKDADGTATIFGRQMRFVISPSMEKCDLTDVSKFEIKDIPTKSMVFIDTVPEDDAEAERWYADLEVGDVLTFKYVYVKQETITHRITDIDEKDGGYIITLEGDNKNHDSDALTQTIDTTKKNSPNYIIGKVVGQSYALGLFLSTLRSPVGIICIIILPCLIILILEAVKIARVLGADRKTKERQEKEQQQNELDELRKRLAELEAERSAEKPAPNIPPSEEAPGTDAAPESRETDGETP